MGNIYVNGCDTKIIQKYLKTMQPAIRALEEFQANIRKEQRIRHDKKLTDSWDQVMKTVSGLPKKLDRMGFKIWNYGTLYLLQVSEKWCYRRILYILQKTCFQSAHPNITRKDSAMCVDNQLLFVLWESLEDFVQSGTESILSRGDARLLVLCSGSFMPERGIKKGGYTDCETTCHEEQRRIFSANGKEISNFVYDLFKQREMRWISCRSSWYYTCCDSQYKGMVYPYTLSDLSRHELKETGLREYALGQKKIDPGKYLYLWKTYPVLDTDCKSGAFPVS